MKKPPRYLCQPHYVNLLMLGVEVTMCSVGVSPLLTLTPQLC